MLQKEKLELFDLTFNPPTLLNEFKTPSQSSKIFI